MAVGLMSACGGNTPSSPSTVAITTGEASSPTFDITGVVRDQSTNATLPGVFVLLIVPGSSGPSEARTTDVTGAFSFSSVQRATVTLQFLALGYDGVTQTVTVAGNVQLDVKLTRNPITAVVPVHFDITGVVRDQSTNATLPRVVVQLIVPDLSSPGGVAATDENGAFSFSLVQRATVTLRFVALGYDALTQNVTVAGNVQLDVKLTRTNPP